MYKFANGIVVFDKETADKYIKSGMKLIEQPVEPVEPKEKDEDDKEDADSGIESTKPRKSGKGFRTAR